MELPDDKTWTWDQLSEIGAELASKAGVPYGMAGWWADNCSARSAPQRKELFTPDGLGFDVAEAQAWYDIMVKGVKAGALGTPEQITEEVPSRWTSVRSYSGMPPYGARTPMSWKPSAAAGGDCLMGTLRGPSLAGKATERKAWYKASMLWSASAKTKHPEAAAAWINWFANDQAAADIDKAERGIPPNSSSWPRSRPSCPKRNRGSRSTSPTSSPRWPTPPSPHPRAAVRWAKSVP